MDIYRFHLPNQLYSEPITFVEGFVKDATYKMPVECIIALEGGRFIRTDRRGRFFICLPAENDFSLQIDHRGYHRYQNSFPIPKWQNKELYKLEIFLKSLDHIEQKEPSLEKELPEISPELMELDSPPVEEIPEPEVVEETPVKYERERTYTYTIFYDFDKYDVKGRIVTDLNLFLESLNIEAINNVQIIGYSDSVGAESYNLILSEKRARSVARFLKQKGIKINSVLIEGRGEIDNASPREQNRRVDVIVKAGF